MLRLQAIQTTSTMHWTRQSDNKDNQTTKTCSQNNRRSNYTNTKSKSTNRNYTSINKRIFTSIVSSNKAARRSKKHNGAGKFPKNKLRIIYANARGIKSKMQSLKQILSKPCHIFAITETLLKDNEKVNIQHFKWIGLNRQNKDGVGIGFLINKSIIKSCTIEPNLNKRIEFKSINKTKSNQ